MVSNGFGEAAIAGSIARAIVARSPGAAVDHAPLVGSLPADTWPPAVGPRARMPSGGLVTYGNVRNLLGDLRAGLARLTLAQFRFLSAQRCRDVVVAVGDVFCAGACVVFARRPTVFVATAKSQYVAPHSRIECAIARRARVTFARDEPTARALRWRGVNARWVGNAMMDELKERSCPLPSAHGMLSIGVLAGSRADAIPNAVRALRRLRLIAARGVRGHHGVRALFALAPSVDAAALMHALSSDGIALRPTGARSGIVAAGAQGSLEVAIVAGCLPAVLEQSSLVLGQAGTGNEQAAGAGRPVVAAMESGEHAGRMGWYRMRQQKLLGDALLVLPQDDERFVRGVVTLLEDPARMNAMARVGRERMGPPGACAAIANTVIATAGS